MAFSSGLHVYTLFTSSDPGPREDELPLPSILDHYREQLALLGMLPATIYFLLYFGETAYELLFGGTTAVYTFDTCMVMALNSINATAQQRFRLSWWRWGFTCFLIGAMLGLSWLRRTVISRSRPEQSG